MNSFLECGILMRDDADANRYRIKFIDDQLAGLDTTREQRSAAGRASAAKRAAPIYQMRDKTKQEKTRVERSTPVERPLNARSKMNESDKKRNRVGLNTPLMVRIGRLFNRRPDTLWTVAEAEALAQLGEIPEADLVTLEDRYRSTDPDTVKYRRQDLDTLLNNWQKELDRATVKLKTGREGWQP